MLISNVTTLEKKLKEFCDTSKSMIPPILWEDVAYITDSDDDSAFIVAIEIVDIVIPKRQTWKAILSSLLEMYEFGKSTYDLFYYNLPHKNPSLMTTVTKNTVTITFNNWIDKNINIQKEFTYSQISDLKTNDELWSAFKKEIVPQLTHGHECPICLSDKIKYMTVCEECHQEACLSCTIKSIRTTHGLHQCPFCRYIEHDCYDDTRGDVFTKEYIKHLLDDFMR